MPVLRLDDGSLTDVAAIKVDVEGAELEVLRGALMRRWRLPSMTRGHGADLRGMLTFLIVGSVSI